MKKVLSIILAAIMLLSCAVIASAEESVSFTVNGEYGNYGVSEQPVYDGDVFTIAYTK